MPLRRPAVAASRRGETLRRRGYLGQRLSSSEPASAPRRAPKIAARIAECVEVFADHRAVEQRQTTVGDQANALHSGLARNRPGGVAARSVGAMTLRSNGLVPTKSSFISALAAECIFLGPHVGKVRHVRRAQERIGGQLVRHH
jgi:hypothetical protein